MALGPPAAEPRVGVDVLGAKRLRRLEHRAEQSVRAGQRTHRRDQLVVHSGDEEPPEPARAVGDAERGVARTGELAGSVDQALEHLVDRSLRGHRQDRVADGLQRRAESLLRHRPGR